jgi:hypothetical protein
VPPVPDLSKHKLAPVLRVLRREARALEDSLAALRRPQREIAAVAAAQLGQLEAGQAPSPQVLLLPVLHRATLAIEEVFTELEDRANAKELRRSARIKPSPSLVEALRAILAELEREEQVP